MHRTLISKLENIISLIRNNDGVDLASLPTQQILDVLESSRQSLAGISDSPCHDLLAVMNRSIQTNDPETFCSVLHLLCIYLDDVDQMTARSRLSSEYLNILTRRLPEYLHLRNNERNKEYYKTHTKTVQHPFTGKGAVYTVVTGSYDIPKAPLVRNHAWDYILFTDSDAISYDGWETVRLPKDTSLTPVRYSRKPKLLCHQFLSSYDYSIYIDASIQIIGDLQEYIDRYSTGESMLCMNHYINCDLYEEAELCKDNKRDDPEVIRAQIDRYRAEGFPEDYGLTVNGFLVRDHRDKKLQKVMEDWWNELLLGSFRDQLSLTYCCWKNDLIYDTSPLFQSDNPYIRLSRHQGNSVS